MAHIVEFKIEGLGGRKEPYSCRLNRDVNIFFGLNGAGKTSLLRILNSAMDINANSIRDVPFRYANVKIHSMKYDAVATYELERSIDPKTKSAPPSEDKPLYDLRAMFEGDQPVTGKPELVWRAKLPAKMKGAKVTAWAHGWLPTTRLYFAGGAGLDSGGLRAATLTDEALNAYFAQAIRYLWSLHSAAVLSEVNQAQQEGLGNVLKALLGSRTRRTPVPELDPHIAYQRMHAFLERQASASVLGSENAFVKRYRRSKQLASVATDINEIEQRIAQITAPRVRLQELITRMFSGPKTINFTDTGIEANTEDGQPIPLEGLSSGEKHALRIFADALRVHESTLLIDEPELSLNVDWQKTLINSMLTIDPNLQIIAATHSPEIMADFPDANIFRL